MNDAGLLLGIGLLMLASIAVDALGRKTFLPRVSLLILLGIAAGPEFLDLLPVRLIEHSHLVTNISLAMVAFLLGGELSFERLRRLGRAIVSVSLLVVVATAAFVGGGLALLGAAAVPALAHRVVLSDDAWARRVDAEEVVRRAVDRVRVPGVR